MMFSGVLELLTVDLLLLGQPLVIWPGLDANALVQVTCRPMREPGEIWMLRIARDRSLGLDEPASGSLHAKEVRAM